MRTVIQMTRSEAGALLALTVIVWAVMGRPATAAAPAAGTLRVVVTDAKTHAPLPLTRVDLYGPRSLRGATGTDGAVPFADTPAGDYDILVRRDGYEDQTVRHVAVVATGGVVNVALQPSPRRPPSWLRQIGRVKGKGAPKASASDVSADDPRSALSPDVVKAAGDLPGVVISQSGSGTTASVFGHSATQTSVSVEGVPVSAFGSATNLQPFALDLFQSVQVSRTSAFGSPGGNVNFTTNNPALDWTGTLGAVYGSFLNAGGRVTSSGTTGRLGLSATHATREEVNPINGLTFADTSGLRYRHDASAASTGDAVKMRYPFSRSHVLYGSLVALNSSAELYCSDFTGVVPCGYGPRNLQSNGLTSAQLKDVFSSGRLDAALTLFHNVSKVDVDQSGRFVAGLPTPSSSGARTTAGGFIVDGQYEVGNHYPVTFHATVDNQTTSVSGSAFGSILPPISSSLSYRDASISGTVYDRRRTSANLAVGLQQQGAQHGTTATFTVRHRPSNADTFTFEGRTGFLASTPIAFSGVADPSALRIDCPANQAAGFGPFSSSVDSGSTTASLAWEHVGRRVSVTASVRHEVDYNGTVAAFVRADALQSPVVGTPYLNAASALFQTACGVNRPVALQDLFFQVTGSAPRVQYDGGELALHADVSRNVAADFTAGLVSARAFGSQGPLFAKGSTLASGAQLPQVPIQTMNLSVVARVGASQLRALGNVHHVGANNVNNLPQYTTVDVGLAQRLRHGAELTVVAQNLTGTYAGVFATPANAVALRTQAGPFGTIAIPLQPRSVYVSLRLPFGLGASLDDVPDLTAGPGSYGYKLYPYNGAVPQDAFQIDRRSGRCGPEAVGDATRELNAVRDYARRVEARRAQDGGYPAAFPTETHLGLVLTYRQNARGYAVLVAADRQLPYSEQVQILRPLAGCSRFYSGSLPETRDRDLYIPTYDESQNLRPLAEYSPAVGFYVPPSRLENDRLFPAYEDPPKTPPPNPFALSTDAQCLPNARSGAEAFVAVMQPYLTAALAGGTPQVPPGFTITDHRDGAHRWEDIESPDLDVKLLSTCLRIAAVNQKTLDTLGLGSVTLPGLGFAPELGFYNRF